MTIADKAAPAAGANGGKGEALDANELSRRVELLEAENVRLQTLVCDLLNVNEELRNRKPDGSPPIGKLPIPVPADDKKSLGNDEFNLHTGSAQ